MHICGEEVVLAGMVISMSAGAIAWARAKFQSWKRQLRNRLIVWRGGVAEEIPTCDHVECHSASEKSK